MFCLLWSGRSGSTLDLSIATFAPTFDGYVVYALRENAVATNRPSLELVLARSEMDVWRMEHFGSAATNLAVASVAADPDHDGVITLLNSSSVANPTRQIPAGSLETFNLTSLNLNNMVYTFRRTHVSASADVYVERSDDLKIWTRVVDGANGVSIQIQSDAEGSGIDRVSVEIPRASKSTQFVRLCVVGLN